MLISKRKCPDCGAPIELTTAEVAFGGELRWFRSYHCKACGAAMEEDGKGVDESIQTQLLKVEGEFALIVKDLNDRPRALVEIRNNLDLDFNAIRKLRTTNQPFVATGTRVQMKWLHQKLTKIEIDSEVISIVDA